MRQSRTNRRVTPPLRFRFIIRPYSTEVHEGQQATFHCRVIGEFGGAATFPNGAHAMQKVTGDELQPPHHRSSRGIAIRAS